MLGWLFGKKSPAMDVQVAPNPEDRPFGVDKPISECTDADIQQSREALWEAADDVIQGWRIDAGLDYRSTPFELAVDGMEARTRAELPAIPDELKMRCPALPITEVGRLLDAEEPTFKLQVSLLSESREELEKVCGKRIYSKKSTKKETGRCYFRGFKEVTCKRGEEAGTFLAKTNALTRRVVLGDELAADFEQQTRKGGLAPQEWVEQVLRPRFL